MATDTRNYDIVNRSGTIWSGLFAGWFSTIGVLTVLLALGAAIGLAAIEPSAQGLPQAQDTGIAAGIWSAISIGIACFVGASIGTMIAGLAHKRDATSFGFTVWAGSLVGIFLLGALVSGMLAPDVVATGQQAGQSGQQLQQQISGASGNLAVLQRAVDATAAGSAWFVVSSALGMLGGVLGGLAARHRTDRSTGGGARRAVVRDRYASSDRYATGDRYADRGVMGPNASSDYPVTRERLAPPPRSGVDYRHVRDVHDDGEAY